MPRFRRRHAGAGRYATSSGRGRKRVATIARDAAETTGDFSVWRPDTSRSLSPPPPPPPPSSSSAAASPSASPKTLAWHSLPSAVRAEVCVFLAQGDWARLARVSREDHRVAVTPRALPSAISVTCASRSPDEHSRCGALARQLPQLAPCLVRITLDCGVRCRIHAAMRLARSALVRLTAFDLTLGGSSHKGCSLPSRMLPRDAASGGAIDAEFRFASLPATVTDLCFAPDLEVTRLSRCGSIVASLPRLVRLALPTRSCGLFWRPRRRIGADGRRVDDAKDDDVHADALVYEEEYEGEADAKDADDIDGGGGGDGDDRGADSQFPMAHLVELLVQHVDHPIRPDAFPRLRTLTVTGDLWASALTSILLNVPQLVELRLGVDRDGSSGTSDAILSDSDLQRDATEEEGRNPFVNWPPAVAAPRRAASLTDANARIDVDPPVCALPRTIRRLMLSRLSCNRAMRRLALRTAFDLDLLHVATGGGVGDLTPFSAHQIARLELPEQEFRAFLAFPGAYLPAGLPDRSGDSGDAFRSRAIERVELLVLRHLPPPTSQDTITRFATVAATGTAAASIAAVTRRATSLAETSGSDDGDGWWPEYAQPHCLDLDTDLDAFAIRSGKILAARFRTLAERYPNVRHLTLPRANLGPSGKFAAVVGDALMRFKRLVTVDVSRLYVRAPKGSRSRNSATVGLLRWPTSTVTTAVALGPRSDTLVGGGGQRSSPTGDQVADILRRCVHPEQLALLRFSPVEVVCRCALGGGVDDD